MTTCLITCPHCHAPIGPDDRTCPWCHTLQTSRESFAPGVTIERGAMRLVLDKRIGEGGMGVVWRAWVFHAPGTPLAGKVEPAALKVLRPQAMALPGARELFLREAEALRRLSHPNVVAYNGLFEHQGALVLWMEYVEGEMLETTVARQCARAELAGGGLPCMPFQRAWYYFQQLLGALAAVHAMGIVHRDVKPSNVFVGLDGLVKLGDFGVARFVGAPSSPATAEFAPGTGAYMSPEQVRSLPLDGRSDLYSAAIVLYRMLSGRTPFSAERGEFLVRQDQVESPPPPIRDFVPQAPPVLDSLFARALAKNPEQRFNDAIDLGEAFRGALGLPDTAVWRAQADIARTANTLADRRARQPEDVAAEDRKLGTLRDLVTRAYKTQRMASA